MNSTEGNFKEVKSFFQEVINNPKFCYTLEDLFGIRVECSFDKDQEMELLQFINTELFKRADKLDLRYIIEDVNHVLNYTLYFDGRQKLPKVEFCASKYQNIVILPLPELF